MKRIMLAIGKGALVWGAFILARIISSQAFPLPQDLGAALSPADARLAGVALLGVSLVNAAVLAVAVMRARLRGWRLFASLSIIVFGVQTFMTQMETLFFRSAFPRMTDGALASIVAGGFLNAVLSAGAACLVFRPAAANAAPASRPNGRRLRWAIPALAVWYVVLYLVFGYFVAWQFAATRVFYSGSDRLVSFFRQYEGQFADSPAFLPFQLLRGILWTGLALLACRTLRRDRFRQVVIAGLVFGLLPSTQLFFPNPLMPPAVRMAHFIEVSISTGIFGATAVALLRPRRGEVTAA